MFCPPIVKLKADKITLKRLSACATHATKRKYTILYKKIRAMAIITFRVHVSTAAGTDIIDIGTEIERIAAQVGDGATGMDTPMCVPRCRAYHVPSRWQTASCCLLGRWQEVVVCGFDNRPGNRQIVDRLPPPSQHPSAGMKKRQHLSAIFLCSYGPDWNILMIHEQTACKPCNRIIIAYAQYGRRPQQRICRCPAV